MEIAEILKWVVGWILLCLIIGIPTKIMLDRNDRRRANDKLFKDAQDESDKLELKIKEKKEDDANQKSKR